MDLTTLTIKDLSVDLKNKKVSSVEVTKEFLKRIGELDGKVNSFMTVLNDEALKMAEEADKRIASGDNVTALTGVPIGLKDIFNMKDVRTTCSSKILENFISPYDSTVAAKLKSAGAVILGKNNMDEFAMGSSTENSAFMTTKNPWDLDCVPGGSSGGSSAAVAASLCTASIGTDTGGSIRQPASLCGVTGFKPTYGRVSRYGMIAFASSLDQAGPLTKTAYDSALLMNVMAGVDGKDMTSLDIKVPDFTDGIEKDIKGLKVGIPKEYFIEGIDGDVDKAVKESIEKLKELGAEIVEVSLPHTKYAVSVYYLVATAEASANLERFDGVRFGLRNTDHISEKGLTGMYKESRQEGFGAEVKRRIMLGTYSLSAGYYDAYYRKASQVRTLIGRDFDSAFKSCDVILTPTSPSTAFKIGEKTSDPLTMYLSDIFTISCNLAGLPGISVPCGLSKDGLPIGLQFLGKALDEATVLRVAHQYQEATDFHKAVPNL